MVSCHLIICPITWDPIPCTPHILGLTITFLDLILCHPPPLPRSGPMMARMPYHGHAGRHPTSTTGLPSQDGWPHLCSVAGSFHHRDHSLLVLISYITLAFLVQFQVFTWELILCQKTTVPPTDRLLSSEVTSSGPNLVDSHQEHKFTSDSGLSQSSYQDVNVHAYQGPCFWY